MSTEKSTTTPSAALEPKPLPMQSSMEAGHGTQHAAVPMAVATPTTGAHACCHTAKIGPLHAGDATTVTHLATHSCTENEETDLLPTLVNELAAPEASRRAAAAIALGKLGDGAAARAAHRRAARH